MKTLLLAFILTAPLATLPAPAADTPEKPAAGKLRARLLERFDADRDGKLSEAERAAARDALKARLPEIRKRVRDRFDANGDGTLDESERAAAKAALRARRTGAA